MSLNSGGTITYNLREGYRSESLAQYIFSAFGPCIAISQTEDYGIDLLCNLSERKSKMLHVKSSFGVQVKSQGTKFEYKGTVAVKWLLTHLEFPILLAEVVKNTSFIHIYSTWNINRMLLQINSLDENTFPENIQFVPDLSQTLEMPTIENRVAKIPLGKPILSFPVTDIGDEIKREQYWKILNEWVEMDSANYRLRRAKLSLTYGYSEWEINNTSSDNLRPFHKHYFFSPIHFESAKKNIAESAVVSALYLKKSFEIDPEKYAAYKNEFNSLRNYILQYCADHLDPFGAKEFENEL